MGFPDTAEDWDPEDTKGVLQRIAEYVGNIAAPEADSLTELVKDPTLGHTHDGVTGRRVEARHIQYSFSTVLTSTLLTANTTAATDIVSYTIPGGLSVVGSTYELWAMLSLINATAGTVNYSPYLRAGATHTFIGSVALAPGSVSVRLHADVTFRTVGASGSYAESMLVDLHGRTPIMGQPGVFGSFDTTVDQLIAVGLQMDVADVDAKWEANLGTIRPGRPS